MRCRRNDHGSSLIEAIAAMAVLGLVAAACARAAIGGTRALTASARYMKATEIAASTFELLRAGERRVENPPEPYQTTWNVAPSAAPPGLVTISVRVEWQEEKARQIELTGFAIEAVP